jgi:hypothetical protein
VLYRAQPRSVRLSGAIATSDSYVVDSGTVELQTPSESAALPYPWTLAQISETANYSIVTAGYARPNQNIEWQLLVPNAAQSGVEVYAIADVGELTFEVETVIPDVDGDVQLRQAVRVGYRTSSTGIVLTNLTPERGAYSCGVQFTGTDCAGTPLWAWRAVGFVGLVLQVGGGWHERWAESMEQIMQRLKRKIPLREGIPPVEMVDRPPPDRFRVFLEAITRHLDTRSASMIVLTRLAHAETVARVNLREGERRLGVLVQRQAAPRFAQTGDEVVALALRVAQLTRALARAQGELTQAQAVQEERLRS